MGTFQAPKTGQTCFRAVHDRAGLELLPFTVAAFAAGIRADALPASNPGPT